MTKYSLNPISEILIQFNPQNIYSVKSLKYLFNPISELFIQSNHRNIYSIYSVKYRSACKILFFQHILISYGR